MMRHRWLAPIRTEYQTDRPCKLCSVVKVTMHGGDRPWIEYWQDAKRLPERPECNELGR